MKPHSVQYHILHHLHRYNHRHHPKPFDSVPHHQNHNTVISETTGRYRPPEPDHPGKPDRDPDRQGIPSGGLRRGQVFGCGLRAAADR